MPPVESDQLGYHLIALELWLIRACQASNQRFSGKAVVRILTPLSECMQTVWALSYMAFYTGFGSCNSLHAGLLSMFL